MHTAHFPSLCRNKLFSVESRRRITCRFPCMISVKYYSQSAQAFFPKVTISQEISSPQATCFDASTASSSRSELQTSAEKRCTNFYSLTYLILFVSVVVHISIRKPILGKQLNRQQKQNKKHINNVISMSIERTTLDAVSTKKKI